MDGRSRGPDGAAQEPGQRGITLDPDRAAYQGGHLCVGSFPHRIKRASAGPSCVSSFAHRIKRSLGSRGGDPGGPTGSDRRASQASRSSTGSTHATHAGVSELADAVRMLRATARSTDVDERSDLPCHQVDDLRFHLELSFDIEQRMAANDTA